MTLKDAKGSTNDWGAFRSHRGQLGDGPGGCGHDESSKAPEVIGISQHCQKGVMGCNTDWASMPLTAYPSWVMSSC